MIVKKTKLFLQPILRRRGRYSFIRENAGVNILDVGCGNDSAYKTKLFMPNIIYTGVDVVDYNNKFPNFADKYICTEPDKFAQTISNLNSSYDLVISSHNLEHCNDRDATLLSMLSTVKVGGYIYLAFPCEDSKFWPSRHGTLNYFDDATHQYNPPNYVEIIATLNKNDFLILFSVKNYKPKILRFLGALLEPLSMLTKRVLPGTWEYYGFETIIWAQRII